MFFVVTVYLILALAFVGLEKFAPTNGIKFFGGLMSFVWFGIAVFALLIWAAKWVLVG